MLIETTMIQDIKHIITRQKRLHLEGDDFFVVFEIKTHKLTY